MRSSEVTKGSRRIENPTERLKHIIDLTNACRNYLLGGFSMFFLLVMLRLFDFVNFSAKLHEFSDLMGNYDLIDITLTNTVEKEPDPTFVIDEDFDEVDDHSVRWPSFIDFNKTEHRKIKNFFKATLRKPFEAKIRRKSSTEENRIQKTYRATQSSDSDNNINTEDNQSDTAKNIPEQGKSVSKYKND
ncbi:unnamed protein product [Diatraea saccharalis]|uniref:Uncharacterized protein n=1 Tax=Diatraea saccharalis TaxID=40085 RepID=A0A9N9R6B4_9NEOP|nr:unnamed protein product [Diatraea saccharalis]